MAGGLSVGTQTAGAGAVQDVDITQIGGSDVTLGQKTMANSFPVVVASDQSSFPVAATLAAETTKVIGTVNIAAAQTIAVTNAGLTALNGAISGTEVQVDVVAALPAGTNNIGDIDVLSVVPGTGATNLGKTEDAAHTTGDTGVMILGVRNDGAVNLSDTDMDYTPIATDAAGRVKIGSMVPGTSATTLGKAVDNSAGATDTGIAPLAVRDDALTTLTPVDGDYVQLRTDSTGRLWTSATVDAALPAGTNNIGDVDVLSIAAGNNNIGDVDIASGTLTTLSTLTGGGVAHDSADSGNPHKIGFKAFSPDGTTPGTAVAENDRTDAKADLDGRLYVNTVSPVLWSYHENSSNALTDAEVKADPGDGFSIFVTDIIFSTGAATACNIFFEEGSTTVLGPWYLEATAGRGLAIHFTTPKKITASTALTVTTSAAIAHGLDVMGYVAAV